MNVSQKVIGNFSNRNIVDVQFITLNKKEQQIKGSLKLGDFYFKRFGISYHRFQKYRKNTFSIKI
jgi:hypothetical protein